MSTTLRRLGASAATAKRPSALSIAGIERDQRHAEQERQRDAPEENGEIELGRVADEARREHDHEPGHGELAENGEDEQHQGETGERLLGEGARRGFALLAVKPLGEERDEGGVERPFGEQPAEQIGDAEGDEEGVGHGAGAEHGRDQNVPDEAEDAAEHGHRADGGECAVEGHRAAGGQRLDVRQRKTPAPRAPTAPWSNARGSGTCGSSS